MENLGAITFRETALLVDERAASHTELERVADVVAHENAHMWFGDLVDDLVERDLAQRGVCHLHGDPGGRRLEARVAALDDLRRLARGGTLGRRAASTRPIEFHVEAPRDADAMFDVLTYEKGASVLRMLEQFLGPAVFRDGVREYLRRHAYANADTGDLWSRARPRGAPADSRGDGRLDLPAGLSACERAARGRPARAEPAALHLPAGRAARLHARAAGSALASARAGAGHLGRAPVDRAPPARDVRDRVRRARRLGAVLVNEGGHGFYRVRYSDELLERLLGALPRWRPSSGSISSTTPGPVTVAGHGAADYLELTARFRGERDRNVWSVLLASFATINRISDAGHRPRLAALVRDRVAGFAELGWTPGPARTS